MKQTMVKCGFVLLILLVSHSSYSIADELDEHLEFLEPLIGKKWVGGFVGSEAPDIQISLRFERILDGNAVSYVREAEAADFTGMTYLYWHAGRREVCFVSLNNRGIVGEGVVLEEDGEIVLRGQSYRPEKTTEFKTTLGITANGILRDTFMRMEKGKWVEGHLQEFVAGN